MLTTEYPPYSGGIGRYCQEVYDAALLMGKDVEVLAPDYDQTLDDPERVHRYRGGPYNIKQFPRIVFALRKLLKSRNYSQIHVADWPMLLALHWCGVGKNIPVTMTFHGTDAIILSQARSCKLLGSHQAAKRIQRVCANSAFTMSLIEKYLPEATQHEKVITPLGVGAQWFVEPTQSQIQAAKELVDLKADEKIVLTVARLDKRKGHDNAIRSLALVEKSLRDKIKYLIIGAEVDQGYLDELKKLAADLDVQAYFVGKQPDNIVKGAYGAAALFLLPAKPDNLRIEGFGLVFLEASAIGLPSLAFNVHAIPEVVKDGINGWCCEPDDFKGMSQKITDHLFTSANQNQSMKQSCIALAKDFTWANTTYLTY